MINLLTDTVIVMNRCPMCGKVTDLELPFDGYIAWENGKLVQNAFPEMSTTDRETLISGMCSKCQKEIFWE